MTWCQVPSFIANYNRNISVSNVATSKQTAECLTSQRFPTSPVTTSSFWLAYSILMSIVSSHRCNRLVMAIRIQAIRCKYSAKPSDWDYQCSDKRTFELYRNKAICRDPVRNSQTASSDGAWRHGDASQSQQHLVSGGYVRGAPKRR